MTKLADKALLVSLNISQWTGRKFDKRATETVAQNHNTTQRAGNFTKKLLPGATELARIGQVASAIREYTYEQTLPWHADGSRILSIDNYLPYAKRMGELRETYSRAVDEFLSEYSALKARAERELGDLFRESEYPSEGQLRSKFGCEVTFMPVPSLNDFRIKLHDSEAKAFEAKMREVEQNAMRECWQRLYETVSRAASTLALPDAKFRDSLVANILDICKLLPKLNVTDDANLEQMRSEVEGMVAKLKVDNLRHVPQDRIDAALALAEAESKMKAFMGR